MPENTSTETWRDIQDFHGYQVSSHGRVRRKMRGYWAKKAGLYKTLTGAGLRKTGHRFVVLSTGKKPYPRYIHRLVLEAFVGPCPPGMECCHWDDDPKNNHLENLRWDTKKANVQDALRNGRSREPINRCCGERHPDARVNESQVLEIRRLYRLHKNHRAVARMVGTTPRIVYCIVHRLTWKHVPDEPVARADNLARRVAKEMG